MKTAEPKAKVTKPVVKDHGSDVEDMAVSMDVLQILHEDHQTVAEMFFQYKQLEEDDEKEELVAEIIKELAIHAQVEEEIVYPAIRKADDDSEDMMDEADTEHHVVKLLLHELTSMKADEDHYDSKVTVLCELVNHHVQEEEKEIFEKLQESDLNLEDLGAQVLKRKEELIKHPPSLSSRAIATSSKSGTKKK